MDWRDHVDADAKWGKRLSITKAHFYIEIWDMICSKQWKRLGQLFVKVSILVDFPAVKILKGVTAYHHSF